MTPKETQLNLLLVLALITDKRLASQLGTPTNVIDAMKAGPTVAALNFPPDYLANAGGDLISKLGTALAFDGTRVSTHMQRVAQFMASDDGPYSDVGSHTGRINSLIALI